MSQLREVEKGPTFEIYQGQQGGVLRLDWNREGALRAIYLGYGEASFVTPIVARWETFLKAKQPITMLHDWWEMSGYDSALRTEMMGWGKKNPGAIKSAHFLTRSKLVNMSAAAVNLVFPGLMVPYSKRTEFDILAKKNGLPLNPPMPAASKPATGT